MSSILPSGDGCPYFALIWGGRVAIGGHLEILKWARAKGCKWDKERVVLLHAIMTLAC